MSLSTVDAFKHIRSDRCIELNDVQLRQLQRVLMDILDDICTICDENGILYELGGGSALGCYREHDFIAWDDDIDINMPRADYERFVPLFRERFGSRYWVHTPQDTPDHGLLLSRVVRKGTSVVTREDFYNREAGAFVDVFVIENTYDSPVLRRIHELGCMAYGFLVSCRKFYRDRKPLMELARSTGDAELIRKFRVKIRIGRLLAWRSLDALVRRGDRWNGRCRNECSRYVVIPTGRRLFRGELYRREELCETREYLYGGKLRRCPAAIERYLSRLYGSDFMTPPPPEQRERHVFFRPFDLGGLGLTDRES
ncbi:LicD family protein [Lachnoclostridium sp. Marseille-P6806]|uniref:LicD family protein n=1 Tax=Lachnoclostridium sp. Marseille-P6806 TaxID=2364793 RepID=UPI0010316226|nr:LicD family protein [Lachnoclostridium sp. Marseille-P6806]